MPRPRNKPGPLLSDEQIAKIRGEVWPPPPLPTPENPVVVPAAGLSQAVIDNPPDNVKIQFTIKIPDYSIYEAERLLIDDPCKRKIVKAGRRSGKTTSSCILAVLSFLKGLRVRYAAPVADQTDRFWTLVKSYLEEPLAYKFFRKDETRRIIEPLGSVRQQIRAVTAWNVDGLRGDACDLLILEEYQLQDEDAWEKVGLPMLADYNGSALLIFTPPSLQSRSTSKARDKMHAVKLFKRCLVDPNWMCLHFTSHQNPFLSAEGLEEVARDMTNLAYRQEILAEDLEEVPGALWTRALLEKTRVATAPDEFRRIVVGVDPSGSNTSETETGIVAVGQGFDNHLYVIADRSRKGTPKEWATAAVDLYHELKADVLVAEQNYGGEMVRHTIETIDEFVAYRDANATRGKVARAQPLVSLFEKGSAHLVGQLPELEEQMCSYVVGDKSPDRLDACFVKGTDILTGRGNIPIETVVPGDFAWTRKGWKKVLNCGLTRRSAPVSTVTTFGGRTLTGTPSHPFWSEGVFVPMDRLVCGSILSCQNAEEFLTSGTLLDKRPQRAERLSFLTGFHITDTPTVSDGICASILRVARMASRFSCIAKYGLRRTVQFLADATFITAMTIRFTMNYRILSAWHQRLTMPSFVENVASGGVDIWTTCERWPRRGMAALLGSCGTCATPNKCGRGKNQNRADDAWLAAKQLPDSARTNVSVMRPALGVWPIDSIDINRSFLAQFAKECFGRVNIESSQCSAADVVLGVRAAGEADVYNLEVEDAHEYFANGILVHNCVWAATELMGYGSFGLIELMKSGKADEIIKAPPQEKVVKPANVAKVMTNDQTPKCPECGSTLIQLVGGPGQRRCGQCAHQWGGQVQTMPVGGRKILLEK